MKKLILIFILTILAIFIIFGYNDKSIIKNINQESRTKEEIMELVSDDHIDSLILNKYSNSDLKKIESDIESYNLDLESLDSKYKIECIRNDTLILPDGGFRVVYRSKNKYLFVYFDKQGTRYWSNISEMVKEKSKYDSVKIGKDSKTKIFYKSFSLAAVSELHFSTSHNVKKSVHYTKDGYMITFDYDENGVVIDKKVDLV